MLRKILIGCLTLTVTGLASVSALSVIRPEAPRIESQQSLLQSGDISSQLFKNLENPQVTRDRAKIQFTENPQVTYDWRLFQ